MKHYSFTKLNGALKHQLILNTYSNHRILLLFLLSLSLRYVNPFNNYDCVLFRLQSL